MNQSNGEPKPDIPACGCGGINKPLDQLKRLVALLEQGHEMRKSKDVPGGNDVRKT
jgi:hypothetical protein